VLFIREIDLDKSERILAILFGKRFPEHLLFFITKIIFLFFAPLFFGSDIYRQQTTTFSPLA
jgi:hypothetical protein